MFLPDSNCVAGIDLAAEAARWSIMVNKPGMAP